MPSHPSAPATPPLPGTASPAMAHMSTTRPVANPSAGPSKVAIWTALGIVYVIWGSTYLGIRIVSASLPPFGWGALRFAVAGTFIAAVMAVRARRSLRISWAQLGGCAVVGLLLIPGGNGLLVVAESPRFGLPSGVAALIFAFNPLLTAVLRTVTGDRPRLLTVVGILVGLGGLVALFLPGTNRVPIIGGLLCFGSVASWCVGSFATRWVPLPGNPFVSTVYELLIGSVVLGGVALASGEAAPWQVPDVPTKAWIGLAYMAVFGSVIAFTAYIWLLHSAPISLVATYAYVNPVIALILGAVVLGEVVTSQILLAAATVVLGVILVVTAERPRSKGIRSGGADGAAAVPAGTAPRQRAR
jgi:drug/metabolite transporter (DMT)-like permease